MRTMHQIDAGFMPLTDSMLLVVAREQGFAETEGVDLILHRETSWANIRDRVAVGQFDVAHMLAPMPIAAALALTPLAVPVIAPMAMGLGGNAVTVSVDLWRRMLDYGAAAGANPACVGEALRSAVGAGRDRLKFGVVHPHSGHNYELRYWLMACGIRPDRDVEIVVLPPPLLPDALKSGRIDGYCVGEPWNSMAVAAGSGVIATTKSALWASSPEKVLGASESWAAHNPDALAALLRALYRAAEWCGDPANHPELASLLARPAYLGVPAELVALALGNAIVPDFFIAHARAATFPWQSHALWFYSQMVRWNYAPHTPENARRAATSYRPDLYRSAIAPLGAPVPSANAKIEGALTQPTPVGATCGTLLLGPDGFFDGRTFDPDALDAYIESQQS